MTQIIDIQNGNTRTLAATEHLILLNDHAAIVEQEAIGFMRAERYAFGLDRDMPVSATLVLNIHRIAFHRLYDWAGQWRDTTGSTEDIHQRVLDYTNNVNYQMAAMRTREEEVACLAYTHYAFNRIRPFDHGNGRTARIILNLVAMKLGYKPLSLCHSDEMQHGPYMEAMTAADGGNTTPLHKLVESKLAFL